MLSMTQPSDFAQRQSGIARPVNLQTDLAPLAELIELVFEPTMDHNDRAAIQEMRSLSRLWPALRWMARLNDLVLGISLGYVWVEEGQLVGNVSLYPANWPDASQSVWIIANVAVHPDYQRRGIARRLMHASIEKIRERGGDYAILQVDKENHAARRLYLQLGFHEERTWITWKRSSLVASPPPLRDDSIYIVQRGRNDWLKEYALAERVRPAEHGGIGWLRPLHPSVFKLSIRERLFGWMKFTSKEHLLIRSHDHERVLASLWAQRYGFSALNTRLTLMVDPDYQGYYDAALLNLITRRYANDAFVLEHPEDEDSISPVLHQLRFQPKRSLVHMGKYIR